MKRVPIRRADTENYVIGDYYDKVNRYYDQVAEHLVVKVFTGDCYVTTEHNEVLVTILGSCVAVCLRDPFIKVGGMNHILLPGTSTANFTGDAGQSTRFGAFAMEKLINEILKLGGKKERMEAKMFGGAQVMNTSTMIGERNIEFVTNYLQTEGIKVHAQDVGGTLPRRIHYFPETGKVKMRKLQRKDDLVIIEKEQAYTSKISNKDEPAVDMDVELFS